MARGRAAREAGVPVGFAVRWGVPSLTKRVERGCSVIPSLLAPPSFREGKGVGWRAQRAIFGWRHAVSQRCWGGDR